MKCDSEALPDRVREWVRAYLKAREVPSLTDSLQRHLGVEGLEGVEFMQDFAKEFGVDISLFYPDDYFEHENYTVRDLFLRCPRNRHQRREVTIGDLVNAAQRGRWK